MVHYAVIGGGIAGVCCVEELCRLCHTDQVTLVSASSVLKGVANVVRLTNSIEEFQVVERSLTDLAYANLKVIQGHVSGIDTASKVLLLASGERVQYDKLCIATGAKPKVLADHERVVTLRDTQSIEEFAQQLQDASRIIVVGNGAIAMELVGAALDVEVVWVLRHAHIGDAFFDVDAAQHLLEHLQRRQQHQQQQQDGSNLADQKAYATSASESEARASCDGAAANPQAISGDHSSSRPSVGSNGTATAARSHGHAAGPKWLDELPQRQRPPGQGPRVVLETNAEVRGIADCASRSTDGTGNGLEGRSSRDPWPVYVQLSNGKVLGADLVVSAIGVEANTQGLPDCIERAQDQGLAVGQDLQTSVPDIYAAGDCCTVRPEEQAPHWFQMRLWTQARLMGMHAAHGMAGMVDSLGSGFNFELFTHVTRFMGQKVVLLGLYNGQKLEAEPANDIIMYSRDAGDSFVRVLLLRGRMQGAVLIGETEMEETCENLILDGLDISSYGPELLDPDFELDHVFD